MSNSNYIPMMSNSITVSSANIMSIEEQIEALEHRRQFALSIGNNSSAEKIREELEIIRDQMRGENAPETQGRSSSSFTSNTHPETENLSGIREGYENTYIFLRNLTPAQEREHSLTRSRGDDRPIYLWSVNDYGVSGSVIGMDLWEDMQNNFSSQERNLYGSIPIPSTTGIYRCRLLIGHNLYPINLAVYPNGDGTNNSHGFTRVLYDPQSEDASEYIEEVLRSTRSTETPEITESQLVSEIYTNTNSGNQLFFDFDRALVNEYAGESFRGWSEHDGILMSPAAKEYLQRLAAETFSTLMSAGGTNLNQREVIRQAVRMTADEFDPGEDIMSTIHPYPPPGVYRIFISEENLMYLVFVDNNGQNIYCIILESEAADYGGWIDMARRQSRGFDNDESADNQSDVEMLDSHGRIHLYIGSDPEFRETAALKYRWEDATLGMSDDFEALANSITGLIDSSQPITIEAYVRQPNAYAIYSCDFYGNLVYLGVYDITSPGGNNIKTWTLITEHDTLMTVEVLSSRTLESNIGNRLERGNDIPRDLVPVFAIEDDLEVVGDQQRFFEGTLLSYPYRNYLQFQDIDESLRSIMYFGSRVDLREDSQIFSNLRPPRRVGTYPAMYYGQPVQLTLQRERAGGLRYYLHPTVDGRWAR